MKQTIDLTQSKEIDLKVVWIDGNGIQRQTILHLDSSYNHGLLCVGCKGSGWSESLSYLSEHGSANMQSGRADEYRKK